MEDFQVTFDWANHDIVSVVIGFGYQANIGRARATLMKIMKTHVLVLAVPSPTVDVTELAGSSLDLAGRCWADTGDYWPVRTGVMEQIKIRFDEEGISVPYHQSEITIRSNIGQTTLQD